MTRVICGAVQSILQKLNEPDHGGQELDWAWEHARSCSDCGQAMDAHVDEQIAAEEEEEFLIGEVNVPSVRQWRRDREASLSPISQAIAALPSCELQAGDDGPELEIQVRVRVTVAERQADGTVVLVMESEDPEVEGQAVIFRSEVDGMPLGTAGAFIKTERGYIARLFLDLEQAKQDPAYLDPEEVIRGLAESELRFKPHLEST